MRRVYEALMKFPAKTGTEEGLNATKYLVGYLVVFCLSLTARRCVVHRV